MNTVFFDKYTILIDYQDKSSSSSELAGHCLRKENKFRKKTNQNLKKLIFLRSYQCLYDIHGVVISTRKFLISRCFDGAYKRNVNVTYARQVLRKNFSKEFLELVGYFPEKWFCKKLQKWCKFQPA